MIKFIEIVVTSKATFKSSPFALIKEDTSLCEEPDRIHEGIISTLSDMLQQHATFHSDFNSSNGATNYSADRTTHESAYWSAYWSTYSSTYWSAYWSTD